VPQDRTWAQSSATVAADTTPQRSWQSPGDFFCQVAEYRRTMLSRELAASAAHLEAAEPVDQLQVAREYCARARRTGRWCSRPALTSHRADRASRGVTIGYIARLVGCCNSRSSPTDFALTPRRCAKDPLSHEQQRNPCHIVGALSPMQVCWLSRRSWAQRVSTPSRRSR
jgi:hypothetical protein